MRWVVVFQFSCIYSTNEWIDSIKSFIMCKQGSYKCYTPNRARAHTFQVYDLSIYLDLFYILLYQTNSLHAFIGHLLNQCRQQQKGNKQLAEYRFSLFISFSTEMVEIENPFAFTHKQWSHCLSKQQRFQHSTY